MLDGALRNSPAPLLPPPAPSIGVPPWAPSSSRSASSLTNLWQHRSVCAAHGWMVHLAPNALSPAPPSPHSYRFPDNSCLQDRSACRSPDPFKLNPWETAFTTASQPTPPSGSPSRYSQVMTSPCFPSHQVQGRWVRHL